MNNQKIHESAFISKKAILRVDPLGSIQICAGAKIDDDVRIVVSANANIYISKNVKIGKGTIINCGGNIIFEDNVSVYGYCYFQTSIWKLIEGKRVYDHGSILISENSVISPFNIISHDVTINKNTITSCYKKYGKWIDE